MHHGNDSIYFPLYSCHFLTSVRKNLKFLKFASTTLKTTFFCLLLKVLHCIKLWKWVISWYFMKSNESIKHFLILEKLLLNDNTYNEWFRILLFYYNTYIEIYPVPNMPFYFIGKYQIIQPDKNKRREKSKFKIYNPVCLCTLYLRNVILVAIFIIFLLWISIWPN